MTTTPTDIWALYPTADDASSLDDHHQFVAFLESVDRIVLFRDSRERQCFAFLATCFFARDVPNDILRNSGPSVLEYLDRQ